MHTKTAIEPVTYSLQAGGLVCRSETRMSLLILQLSVPVYYMHLIIYVMISVTCPEALMGLSAMVFYIMRSRDYPTSA